MVVAGSYLPRHHRLTTAIMIHSCSIWTITNLSTNSTSKLTRPSCLGVILFWRARSASSSSRWPRRSRTLRSGSICRRWSTNRLCMMPWECMSHSVSRLIRCTFSTTHTSTQPSKSYRSSSGVISLTISRRPCSESMMATSTPSTTSCSGLS